MDDEGAPPILGRPSTAAAEDPRLGRSGEAATATYRATGGTTGWCTVRAATVVGVRHRLAGKIGQDSFAWSTDETRIAIAVADGLGAVTGSEEAASAAANAAVIAAISDQPSTEAESDPVRVSIRAANQASEGKGATTIVVAVADSDGCVNVARVGDSTAFILGADGVSWTELFQGDTAGETLDPSTDAIPADHPRVELAECQLGDREVLVLATDGVANPWRDGPTTVAPAFATAVSRRPTALQLARLADFSRQGCHDDRTIVALWMGS